MESTVTYQCPNCGAGLNFDPEKQKFACEFCLSDFTEDELKNTDAAERAESERAGNEEYCEQMLEYRCPSCGAEIAVDESTAADYCYFCHNPVVLVGKLSGQKKPHKIIPFKFGRDEAKEKFLAWAKTKKFCPNDFFSEEHAGKIQGVYYPFWVTDADSVSNLNTVAHRTRVWFAGNRKYIETSDFKVFRKGEIHFEDIVTSALSDADKAMLEGVLPYPSDSLIDFNIPYLQGFSAKKRDIERDRIEPEIKERMNNYANTLLRGTVQGYNSVDRGKTEVKVKQSHWDYTLMPIWILTYKMRGKTYTFAMNGYTEKIYGELPISRVKLWLTGAAAAIGAAVAAFGLGVLICL